MKSQEFQLKNVWIEEGLMMILIWQYKK